MERGTHIWACPWGQKCPASLSQTGGLPRPCSASCCRRSRSAGEACSCPSPSRGPGTSWHSSPCYHVRFWSADKEQMSPSCTCVSSHTHLTLSHRDTARLHTHISHSRTETQLVSTHTHISHSRTETQLVSTHTHLTLSHRDTARQTVASASELRDLQST